MTAGSSSNPFTATDPADGTQTTLAFPTAGTQKVQGSFTYDYFFSLSNTALLDGITASASSTFNRQPNVTFSSFEIVGVTGKQPVVTFQGTANYFPQQDYTLNAGTTYELVVDGTTTKNSKKQFTAGSFNGNLTVSGVSTVPLPTSVAMFGTGVLGLGALGLVRRKKAANVSAA